MPLRAYRLSELEAISHLASNIVTVDGPNILLASQSIIRDRIIFVWSGGPTVYFHAGNNPRIPGDIPLNDQFPLWVFDVERYGAIVGRPWRGGVAAGTAEVRVVTIDLAE